MQKQRIILVIGIGLALITVGLIKVYLDQQKKIALQVAQKKVEKAQAEQTAVLVAKKDIPQGETIDPADLELKVVSNRSLLPGAVTSLERISGMITQSPIAKGEQVTRSALSYQRTGDLASATPVGKRAIAISVDDLASIGGLIKPGDYVDVIAMLNIPMATPDGKQVQQITTIPLFQNVLILAVGQDLTAGSSSETRYKTGPSQVSSLITLALSPQEANLVTFVQEQGKLRLVLRSPTDAKIEPIQAGSWEALFKYIMPQAPQETAQQAEQEPISYVEIYRGLNKDKLPLSDK